MTRFAHTPPRVLDLSFLPDCAIDSGDVSTWRDGRINLLRGDCLAWMDALPENTFDAVITDPPYHYNTIVQRFSKEGAAEAQFGTDGAFKRASAGFMGKQWDGGDIAFRSETWAKALRVLKPGGHLAAFSAPKCVHKMAIAIETAGFEVRDRIIHLHDPSPAVAAFLDSLSPAQAGALFRLCDQFGGLGKAFWCFGSGFPKSHNVSKAIDRMLGAEREVVGTQKVRDIRNGQGRSHGEGIHAADRESPVYMDRSITQAASPQAVAADGWGTALKPAYEPIVIARKPIDAGSVAAQFMDTGTGAINVDAARLGDGTRQRSAGVRVSDNGSMSSGNYTRIDDGTVEGRFPANLTTDGDASAPDEFRYFYTAKAGADDRLGAGHPTVKPLDLMQWLCRMLCAPGGLILDPFAGTGTTAEAAHREGMSTVLCEREPDYQADIERRVGLLDAGPQERARATTKAKQARRKSDVGQGLFELAMDQKRDCASDPSVGSEGASPSSEASKNE